MLVNLFIIVFILLVIHCVWQNNKINKIKISIVTYIVDKYSDSLDKVSFVSALAFPKLAKARPRIL